MNLSQNAWCRRRPLVLEIKALLSSVPIKKHLMFMMATVAKIVVLFFWRKKQE